MQPVSLSATAAQMFETCEARYKASYIERSPDLGGDAGLKGNCVHSCLELWVTTGQHLQPWPTVMDRERAMKVIFDMTFYEYFSDDTYYAECWQMLAKWVQRQDWSGRTVLSTEVKNNFQLPTSKGNLTVNYIYDRKDRLDADGSIEVVDYKTVAQPISAERMKLMIQPRLYALSAAIEHKADDPPRIWVTYDLLRYDQVSVSFTREECLQTWNYLKALAERIYKSDGIKETLNPECRFCVRSMVCETLKSHIATGGVLSVPDISSASDELAKLTYARAGLDSAIEKLQDVILAMAQDGELLEWETETTTAKVTASSRREADSELVSMVVGPDIMARYGKLGIGTIEKILKEEELTDSQRSQIRQLIRKNWGQPRIEVKPKSPFQEE